MSKNNNEIKEPVIVNPGKEARPTLGGTIDPKVRDEAIRRIFEEGQNVVRVCRDLKINRTTLQKWLAQLKEDREVQAEFDNMKLADLFLKANYQLLAAVSKDKLEKASVKDLLIAAGIAADKRKELLGPQRKGQTMHLKVAWKDGGGAIEFKTE